MEDDVQLVVPVSFAENILGKLVVIVGPTAVGKSALALKLAREIGGEIVSADSRQVYRGLDIGTAKPAPDERTAVPHHLLDCVEPWETLGVAQYQRLAFEAIDQILERGKVPFLVGGTGLYVRAVVEGMVVPSAPPDAEFRAVMERRAADGEGRAIYEELVAADPDTAATIDWRNTRRVIRALEVLRVSGRTVSELRARSKPRYDVLKIGLTRPRSELYQRIDERVDDMVAQGLVDEVRGLLAAGVSKSATAMTGLGYRQMAAYVDGECSLSEAVARIKTETHRFVRQQYTWFRINDASIVWFDAGEPGFDGSVIGLVRGWLAA